MTLRPHANVHVRELVLLRYVLIIAVSYLLLMRGDWTANSTICAGIIAAALASNVLLGRIGIAKSAGRFQVAAVVVVLDAIWISASMVLTDSGSPEFFFLYFFVLFLAALAENLLLMLVGVIAVCLAYLWVLAEKDPSTVWHQTHLLEITSLFSAALFYGVLVHRIRSQQRHIVTVEAADRARTELLATLAHDISSPTTAIGLGISSLGEAVERGDRNEARPLLSLVQRNSDYLRQLVQNFTEYARVHAGKYRLRPTRLSVTAIVQRSVDQHRLAAQARGLSLVVTSGSVPPCLLDEVAVTRIVDNLVANAVRHAEPGTAVEIETSTDDGCVTISVANAGAGLDRDVHDAVGQPFIDVPRTHGGVGLGLFIASALAEAHGGSLATEERPGGGWRCVIELPLIVDGKGGDPPAPTDAPAGGGGR